MFASGNYTQTFLLVVTKRKKFLRMVSHGKKTQSQLHPCMKPATISNIFYASRNHQQIKFRCYDFLYEKKSTYMRNLTKIVNVLPFEKQAKTCMIFNVKILSKHIHQLHKLIIVAKSTFQKINCLGEILSTILQNIPKKILIPAEQKNRLLCKRCLVTFSLS